MDYNTGLYEAIVDKKPITSMANLFDYLKTPLN